jgi:hypothetical protein
MANFNVTIPGANITPLITPEQVNDYTVRYVIPFSLLVATGSAGSTDTVTVLLGNTPANWYVSGAYAWLSTIFAGTTGGLSLEVGTTASAAAFLPNTTVLSGGFISASTGPNTTAVVASSSGATTTAINAIFTNSVSGGMTGLTAGSVEILLSVHDLTQPY